jgi:FkbM family methyltransferase
MVISLFERRVVTHKYWRWVLKISIEDPTGGGWYDRDWPESTELRLLTENTLHPGAKVFDLGAHQGVVALMLASAVGHDGSVLAVEADPVNVAVANRNRELNGSSNLTILNAAVSESSGQMLFDTLEAHLSPGKETANTQVVPAITIDELSARFGVPDLVYMDIEGSEARALKGAAQTLASHADWYIEIHEPADLARLGSSSIDVLGFFPRAAYELMAAPMYDEEFASLGESSKLLDHRFFLFAKRRR